MPLVEMKSKLSQVNTNFGSDTTTAGINASLKSELRTAELPNSININFNSTPISNYVSAYSLPALESTSTSNTTTTTIQAQTQQESGNLFAGGIPPVNVTLSQPLTKSTPRSKYERDVVPPSVLLNLHQGGRKVDLGFTRQGLSLGEYYNQINDNTGTLGIRNDRRSQVGFEQPFVIRNIGERWGIDKTNISSVLGSDAPTGLGRVVRTGLNILDDVGGAILGREPSIFIDRYVTDIGRLTKAANPVVSIFALKQAELQKRNPFDAVTSVKYGLAKVPTISIDDPLSAFVEGQQLLLDPKVYNPLSIYGPISMNRMGIINASKLRSIAAKKMIGIAKHITIEALDLVQEVGTKFIQDISPFFTPVKNAARGFTKDLKQSKFIQEVDERTQGVQDFLGDTADYVKEKGEHYRDKAKAFAGKVEDAHSKLSKATQQQLDPRVFSNVKVDKVNLIPYGSRDEAKINGKTEEELDWIPFKFEDLNNNKCIVFRAILSGISDTFTPEYSSERYVGRPDSVHVYQGTNREITFTFDVYPKSDKELAVLWEKLNYLAGLTYPDWAPAAGGGKGMISPFSTLTIGQMYTNAPGYISSLTYTVQDNGTWETTFAKLPKYIQVGCTFVYVGDRLPASTQKHFDLPWVAEEKYVPELTSTFNKLLDIGKGGSQMNIGNLLDTNPDVLSSFIEKG